VGGNEAVAFQKEKISCLFPEAKMLWLQLMCQCGVAANWFWCSYSVGPKRNTGAG